MREEQIVGFTMEMKGTGEAVGVCSLCGCRIQRKTIEEAEGLLDRHLSEIHDRHPKWYLRDKTRGSEARL